ncbi:transglutaminase-like domain-containing protein [Roseibium sp.]|uniref:transglutaminase-like domain-containing protein n=1 Tax=Roseibium sp. TaxID=1936156 RepID=UPI003A98067A
MNIQTDLTSGAAVRVKVNVAPGETRNLLVPLGISTPDQQPLGLEVSDGHLSLTTEGNTGQRVGLIRPAPDATAVTLDYRFGCHPSQYPESLFRAHDSRFSRVAADLLQATEKAVPNAGPEAVAKVVAAVHARFVYGHPEVRFNDGLDEIPYLACGVTEGSCVDINTYLVACLRAAGIEAGYVTGYFFPAEKSGTCVDMHCWVVSRFNGVVQEWDIAHHLKLGKSPVVAGLNPKPGCRVALFHSMGLSFKKLGVSDTKRLAEPVWVGDDGLMSRVGGDGLTIQMTEGFMHQPFARQS